MNKIYKNHYGIVELEFIGDIKHVNKIKCKDIKNKFKYSIETLEKISLITNQKKIQLVLNPPKYSKGCILFHETINQVYLCKIKKLNYISRNNPQKEIEKHFNKGEKI